MSLLLLGVGGVILSIASSPPARGLAERITLWGVLVFPLFVAFQVLPLPVALLRIVDPARATIADSLTLVGLAPSFAPLTIAPDKTLMHLSRITGYVLIFLLARYASQGFRDYPWLVVIPVVVLGTLEAALGLAQSAANTQATGTYLNKNHYAGLVEMVLPLALMLSVSAWRRPKASRVGAPGMVALLAAGASLALFAAVPLSLSRAGFLSMLASLAVMAGVWLFPRATFRQRLGMIASAPVMAVVALVVFPTDQLVAGLGELGGGDGRWPVAKDSLRMFADFPLFGIGLGTYYPGFLPYQTTALDTAWTTTHNDYLQYLNELGLVGAALPALVVALVWRGALKTVLAERDAPRGFMALGCLGGLTAMLVHSVADFNMYIPANAMVFMFVAGVAASLAPASLAAHPESSLTESLFIRAAVGVLGGWLVFNSAAWLAFLQRYDTDPGVETSFCRVGVCNYYVALAATKARHGGVAANVPPEELISLLPRDPAGGYNWIDLGESLEAHGRLDVARASFARGLEVGPNIPYFLMRAAHFHFRRREFRAGLPLMVKSYAGNPSYEEAGFTAYQQYEIPVNEVLELGLGTQRTAQAFLRKLVRDGNFDDSEITWAWLDSKGWVDAPLASDYVSGLVAAQDFSRAVSAWSAYSARSGRTRPEGLYNFNGGFDWDPADGPFDWMLRPTPGVRVTFDDAIKLAGARSARLDFDGTKNVTAIGLTQGVWLPPGRYRLQAMVKTEGVTTREGVALALEGPGVSVSTESRVGTSDWAPVACEFDVPADIGLVQLKVVRPRIFRFDNKIAGTAWIDQVSIMAAEADPL